MKGDLLPIHSTWNTVCFLFTSFPGSLRLVQNGAGDVKEDVIMRFTGGGTLDTLAFSFLFPLHFFFHIPIFNRLISGARLLVLESWPCPLLIV